jgi:hypothetical protein
MEDSQTDVKMESPSTEDVKQLVSEDVKPEQVPYSRFKEINDKNKALTANYDKLALQISDIEEAKLIQEGKKDDVIANLKGSNVELQSKVKSLEGYVNEERSNLLASFPEEKRGMYAEVDLSVLRDIASDRQELTQKKVGVDSTRGGTSINPPKAFHEMSMDDKADPTKWQAYLETFRRK